MLRVLRYSYLSHEKAKLPRNVGNSWQDPPRNLQSGSTAMFIFILASISDGIKTEDPL